MSTTHIQPTPSSPLTGVALLRAMADKWWLVLLRGIAAIIFGVLAFVWPVITLLTLTFLWGAFAVADGILALWGAITGLLAFAWPGVTALVLLLFIAVWAIIIGVMQIWGAIQLRKEIEGEWLLILSGLLSVAFGVLLLVQPGAGALAVVWIIGWYAILAGCIYIALAVRLKKYKHSA
jgi:uncharacterized membrane protein HdeD (DUF308 family)